MIRRSDTTVEGQRRWILIPQVEHARISAELAEDWEDTVPLSPADRDQLLAAIRRHDDGWADWDAAPEVDPLTGIPRDFTEMPLAESLAIWRGSIAAADMIGPLAAYAVSGHFSALLRQFPHWRSESAEIVGQGEAFLGQQDARREEWLLKWSSSDSSQTRSTADLAVAALQFFDRLSLWICCMPREEPLDVQPPGSHAAIRLTPGRDHRITIHPWPLTVARLDLAAPGRAIRVTRYADCAKLEAAEAEEMTLRWTVTASAGAIA